MLFLGPVGWPLHTLGGMWIVGHTCPSVLTTGFSSRLYLGLELGHQIYYYTTIHWYWASQPQQPVLSGLDILNVVFESMVTSLVILYLISFKENCIVHAHRHCENTLGTNLTLYIFFRLVEFQLPSAMCLSKMQWLLKSIQYNDYNTVAHLSHAKLFFLIDMKGKWIWFTVQKQINAHALSTVLTKSCHSWKAM